MSVNARCLRCIRDSLLCSFAAERSRSEQEQRNEEPESQQMSQPQSTNMPLAVLSHGMG